MAGISTETAHGLHKEMGKARIVRDEKDVQKVKECIESWVNPFEHTEHLTSVSTGQTASAAQASDLLCAHAKGKEAMTAFMHRRLRDRETDFFSPISKQKLNTFSDTVKRRSVKIQGETYDDCT